MKKSFILLFVFLICFIAGCGKVGNYYKDYSIDKSLAIEKIKEKIESNYIQISDYNQIKSVQYFIDNIRYTENAYSKTEDGELVKGSSYEVDKYGYLKIKYLNEEKQETYLYYKFIYGETTSEYCSWDKVFSIEGKVEMEDYYKYLKASVSGERNL